MSKAFADALLKYLTFMEQHEEATRWIVQRWPNASEKGSVPEDEFEREIAQYFDGRSDAQKSETVERCKALAQCKFEFLRDDPNAWRELAPKLQTAPKYSPEDHQLIERALQQRRLNRR